VKKLTGKSVKKAVSMVVYNLYIFDREGTHLFYMEWKRYKQADMSHTEEGKLMYGLIYSLKTMCQKISLEDSNGNFMCYRTNKYMLNYLETPTGLKFILNTDINAMNVQQVLQQLYQSIFVEFVSKNPECEIGKPIQSELFRKKVQEFMATSPVNR